MEFNPIRFGSVSKKRETKTFFVMRAIGLLTLLISLTASSQTTDTRIRLSVVNAPVEQVLKEIRKQSGFEFVYTREQLKKSVPITLQIQASLDKVLEACFKEQPFTYVVDGKFIALRDRTESAQPLPVQKEIKGKVVDEKGLPISSVTVAVKNSGNATSTDSKGEFYLNKIREADVLIISAVGYQLSQVAVKGKTYFEIILPMAISEMDETMVIAYGTTTKKLNTGNVTKVSSKDIEKQPISNVLAALEGRVPGMIVTQSSGVPGSSFNVEIRGRTSLDLGLSHNDPLFIIDGVPFEPGILPSNQLVSAANQPRNTSQGGLSPLNILSPSDIESIEVLKDADATAIYGSRGANGVILITTKKGRSGRTTVSANFYSGWSKVSRTMRLLNTSEYVRMRKEALANDGFTPQVSTPFSNGYAPDLLTWDTTSFTDYKKLLIGNTAHANEAELSLSGGNVTTQFLIGGSYHRETNVFSQHLFDRRGSFHFNISHSPTDKKWSIQLSGMYSSDHNELLQRDLTQYINLPPNLNFYDSTGNPNWVQNGVYTGNLSLTAPAAEYLKKYRSVSENLVSNLFFNYRLLKNLSASVSLGFNKFSTDEAAITPKYSINPTSPEMAFSNFANGWNVSWIAEPQFNYSKKWTHSKIDILTGLTLQDKQFKSVILSASNYTNDLLLYSPSAAGQLSIQNGFSKYKYAALFARATYNVRDQYILNATARRDGSSRFGPGNRFSNFGAIGAAWIFASAKNSTINLKFLSFGKLRGSFGVTGNDQIGDYRFLDLWNSTTTTYQGNPGLQPGSLFNPNYHWEKNRKLEAAVELGFFKDRLFVSSSYYNNRSGNQLINYKLPDQTGFSSVVRNFPAVVENSGVELVVNSKNLIGKDFNWSTSFNLTIPKNKLVSFPGLATSSYATSYVEGQPLSIVRGYRYLGVDPQTGVYTVEDFNKDGKFSSADYQMLGNLAPKSYGGIQNNLSYKNWEFSFFFEGRKQRGKNYLSIISNGQPGIPINQPVVVFNRWTKPGDVSTVQKFTSLLSGPAALGAFYLSQSDGIYGDASFIRLKNVSVSYELPGKWLRKMQLGTVKIYAEAQNPFVLTRYKGSDPEIRDILTLPVLKTFAAGIQAQF